MMKLFHVAAAVATTFFMTAAVHAQQTQQTQKGWYELTNAPGWKGYGSINQNGWLIPERFQNVQTGEIQEVNGSGNGTATTGQTSAQVTPSTQTGEELGPEQQVVITGQGLCVGQQVLRGSPDAIGKWRVKYKVNTPDGSYTYKAQGHGAQSYAASGHWFVSWLNGVRAQYGLPAVGYDPNLENWAAMNNAQQAAHGLGHHVMGPARRQNSAMGGAESIGSMWMASPGHRSALLDPSIRYVGLAGNGAWWTFNAY